MQKFCISYYHTDMDKKSYLRPVPRIDLDRELFPE